MDETQKMTEREVAKRLLENVDNLTKSYEGLSEEIDSIRTNMKNIEGIESEGIKNADVLKEFETLRATVEDMKEQSEKARSARGDGIAGLKDEAHKFSLIRAMDAIHTNSWEKAGFEREVLEHARTKAQAIGVGTAGGYFVPDEVLDDVIQAIYTRSALINLGGDGDATRISVLDGLSGGTVKVPKFLGGLVAYFIGEEDEYTESQTRVGDVVMTPKKLAVMVRLTQEMRNYAGFGFENLLREDMVRAAAKKLDNAILYGAGTADEPRGIVNSVNTTHLGLGASELNSNPSVQVYSPDTVLAGVNSDGFWNGSAPASGAVGGALDFDDLDKMKALLEDISIVPDENAAFLAHPKFFRKLRQLKVDNFSGQSSDQPYLLGMPMISDERLAEVIGPFVTSTQVTTNQKPGASYGWGSSAGSTFGNVFYGNWNEVLLGRWGGIEIDDDAGRGKGFTRDHIYVKMRMYLDVGMRHDQSIVVCDDANYA